MSRTRIIPLAIKLIATAALATAALLIANSNAGAAPSPILSGSMDWGVKASFRTYVEGPVAMGTITVSNGATRNPDGTFYFPAQANGTHDPATDETNAFFNGQVSFLGHAGALDMTMSDVRMELDGDVGILRADVVSKDFDTQQLNSYPDVAFADLDLTSINPSVNGSTYTWTGIPAILSEDGEPAFAGFYEAGEQLDPITMSLTLSNDADGDGIPDGSDTCVYLANPTQERPSWALTSNDPDCDGFTTAMEGFVGTNAADHCANDTTRNNEPSPDAWPPDFDDNKTLSTLDLIIYVTTLNTPANYVARADLNGNGVINTLDLTFYAANLSKTCT
jgi:hypothetical protein